MNKKPLIGVSILAVVLLVLGSLSNVVESERTESCGCGDPPCWPELSGTMGENNWYVSSVFVGFNGSFDEIHYRIDGEGWQTYTAPFGITNDGVHLFEWYCDDNMSNIGSIEIKVDKTRPLISVNYTWERKYWNGYFYIYNVQAVDMMSGMNRTEFFINYVLQETIIGPGPIYEYRYSSYYTDRYNVKGFILHPEITDEYVKFYSLLVYVSVIGKNLSSFVQRFYAYDNAGNWDFTEICNHPTRPTSIIPGLYLFKNMTFPHHYNGTVGRLFVKATFFDDIGVN